MTPKSCTRVITLIQHHVTSHKATPFGFKVPSSNTLHFKAIFDSSLKNVVRKTLVTGKGCATKFFLFFKPVKNLGAQHLLGAEIWLYENFDFGGQT